MDTVRKNWSTGKGIAPSGRQHVDPIERDAGIASDYREPARQSLSYEHAIERVIVMPWETSSEQTVSHGNGKRGEAVAFELSFNVVRRVEPAQCTLD